METSISILLQPSSVSVSALSLAVWSTCLVKDKWSKAVSSMNLPQSDIVISFNFSYQGNFSDNKFKLTWTILHSRRRNWWFFKSYKVLHNKIWNPHHACTKQFIHFKSTLTHKKLALTPLCSVCLYRIKRLHISLKYNFFPIIGGGAELGGFRSPRSPASWLAGVTIEKCDTCAM